MSYIQLKVRSGGIYIKQKNKWDPIKLDLMPHPENKNQKVLSLVRERSIKGLFSYLIGETEKIEKIKDIKGKESSNQKLNATLDLLVQASAYQKLSELQITTFFERRDVHTREFITDPNVNLYQHTFKTANPTIKILEQPLRDLFKTATLGQINKEILESKIEQKDSDYDDLESPSTEAIPNTKLGKEMKDYFEKVQQRRKPIYKKTIKIIDKVNTFCSKDTDFRQNFEEFSQNQFSSFSAPNFTKFWVDKKYHKIVRGTPAFLACVDFNIYLSESAFEDQRDSSKHWAWDEVVEKFKQGPSLARWGEGGVVFINYEGLDEMGQGYKEKDDMFVEINQLRTAGMKIRKYEWEEGNESKTKK